MALGSISSSNIPTNSNNKAYLAHVSIIVGKNTTNNNNNKGLQPCWW